jgi:hypothetical protein
MNEQQAKPPALHFVSCLYVVTVLVAIYLGVLWFVLPDVVTYRPSPNIVVPLRPSVRGLEFLLVLIALFSLAVSYWERSLLFAALSGLTGIMVSFGACTIFFRDVTHGVVGNHYSYTADYALLARNSVDYSYYPLKYLIALTFVIMLLRVMNYRPTTFRLSLLDLMLITFAVAIILGTRGNSELPLPERGMLIPG